MTALDRPERYRELRRLGLGGMGEVFLAEDLVLGRRVALKRLRRSGNRRELLRLRREALVGASLNHPNLVSVFDVTAEDEELVIVMEYVEGQTLRDTRSQNPIAAHRATEVISAVAGALDYIHGRGVVHRDVKPANILLGVNGAVKLGDLGIASSPDRTRITTTGAIMGTVQYMAPEQLAGEPSTPAVDVYALAAVAFEALSGRKARQESNPVALAHAISTKPPPDLRGAWLEAPAEAAAVLTRAMARDPGERPHGAGELASLLRAALQPRTPTPRAPSPVARPAANVPRVPAAEPVLARVPRAPIALPRSPSDERGRPDGRPARSAGDRRSALLVGALIGAALVVVGVVAATSGGGARNGRPAAAAGSRRAPRPGSPGRSPRAGGAGSPGGAGASATVSAGGTVPAGINPSTPAGAVEAFYLDAAAHRYADAWALADPTFQAQLQGFENFRRQQSGVRSLTFHRAALTAFSRSAATVAVQTTPVLADGTHHCTGTVDVVRARQTWMLHQIHIGNC